MKRKIVTSMLILTCMFSIIGCSDKKSSTNTENKATEITATKEDEQAVAEEKKIVDDITVKFNDKDITFPMSYTYFLNLGFNCTSLEYDNDSYGNCFLSPETYASVTDTTDYISFTDNDFTISPILFNDSKKEDKAIKDCNIIGCQYNNSILTTTNGVTDVNNTEETNNNSVITNTGIITFAKGDKTITVGTSTADDVKAFLDDKEYIDNSKCSFVPSYNENNILIGFKYFSKP